MQLQFQKSTLQYLQEGTEEVKNTEVTQEIRLSEGMPDVGRILGTWGQCLLRSKQWQADTIEVSGGVKTWTMYLPEDGSEPRILESWLPFQQRWEVRSGGQTGPMRILPLLRYADSRSISARKIMLRAGIGILCQTYLTEEAEIFKALDLPEDLAVLQRQYPVMLPVEAGEKAFLLDEEESLPLSGGGWKILMGTLNPEVTEQRIVNNRLAFKGNGNLQLLCRNGDGQMQSVKLELPFSQLAELERDYSPRSKGDLCLAVTDLETDLQESGQLRIKCGLVCQYLIDEEKMLEIAEDAYSPGRQVKPEFRQLQLPAVLESRYEKIPVEFRIPGQSGHVLACSFLPDHPRQRQGTEEVHLELSGQLQILLQEEDGLLQCAAGRWETDRVIPMDSSCTMSAQNPVITQVRPTEDGSLGISGTMHLRERTCNHCSIPMITGIEYSETRQEDDKRPSLILRRCGGRSLWEIAKECGSTVEAICRANGLEGEPVKDRMILIPTV